jgi:hypothetical protein
MVLLLLSNGRAMFGFAMLDLIFGDVSESKFWV